MLRRDETSQLNTPEIEPVHPVLRDSIAHREKYRELSPPDADIWLPKAEVSHDVAGLLEKPFEDLIKAGITPEMIERAVDNDRDILTVEVPAKIDTVQEVLEFYSAYADAILKKASVKISKAKGTEARIKSAEYSAALFGIGTSKFLSKVKEVTGEDTFREVSDRITLSSELILLSMADRYGLNFTEQQRCSVIVEAVDYLVTNPTKREEILAFTRERTRRLPDILVNYLGSEEGILAEVTALQMLATSEIAQELDLKIVKSPPEFDSAGVDATITAKTGINSWSGIPIERPLVFVDIKKEPYHKGAGICVAIPDGSKETGYSIVQSGIPRASLADQYEIDADKTRQLCAAGNIPILFIRIPGELVARGTNGVPTETEDYKMVYNTFQSQVAGELRYAIGISTKK